MTRLVRYSSDIDKNINLDPQNSDLARLMKNNIRDPAFNTDFYSFDGDGLSGYVIGSISVVYILDLEGSANMKPLIFNFDSITLRSKCYSLLIRLC